jgi:hypothetical protein
MILAWEADLRIYDGSWTPMISACMPDQTACVPVVGHTSAVHGVISSGFVTPED